MISHDSKLNFPSLTKKDTIFEYMVDNSGLVLTYVTEQYI